MATNFLTEHGTAAFALPPSAVLHAAKNDFAQQGRVRARYAFLPAHVAAEKSPADLLRRAIEGQGDGVRSREPSTKLLYRDTDLLRAALELAEVAP